MKENIKNTIIDLVSDFLYYARKEDEDLPLGEIENSIESGETTIEEIISVFEKELRETLEL